MSVIIINALLILGTALLYADLPLDGSSGDSSSFTPEGFVVHRLIESRPKELEVGDIITHIEGASVEELLHRSPFGQIKQNGEIVEYEIIRNGSPLSLSIKLRPVPFQKVISNWGLQILTILGLFSISIFLFWKRPNDQALRWIVFFSTTISVQYWIDAYSIQPATLLYGWVFWFQKILDQLTYSLPYAATVIFILAFLYPKGLLKRYPIILPSVLLFSGTLIKWIIMSRVPTLSAAFIIGNKVSVIPAMVQLALALGISIFFLFTSQNVILLAQLRILFWGSIPSILLTFIYSVSLGLSGTPIIPGEIGILFVLFIPLSFTIAILRYQIFDIKIIVNKGLVYGSLTLLLGSFYLILVIALTFLLQTVTLGFNQDAVVFISTLSIALLFNPLKQWVQRFIDTIFFRSKINYQRLLPEMSAKLSNNIVLEQLTQLLTEEIPHQLQISGASLEVFGTDKRGQPLAPLEGVQPQLEEKTQNQTKLSIPLIVGKAGTQGQDSTERLIGRYNLGAKLSAKPYSAEEVNLLTTLGKQAAVSVENARLYQQVERYNRILERRILERTQELADAKHIAENANTLLEKVLDNIDALIYVSDMQTGEILFANQPLLEEYGDIQGKICWQVLYKDKSAPCQTCSNAILLTENNMPTGAHRQEIQDTLTKRWYSLMSSAIQWIDGRTVRLATRLDITEVKEAEMLLVTHEREASREKERRRLARNLHDTLTQSLHSLVLMADTSKRLLEKEQHDALPETIQLLSDSARQALREMRLLLHELQLSEDKQINLQESLSTRLGIIENQIGIKTELKINGQAYLSKIFSKELFYIIIEALNNAIKHSNAKKILVSIQASPEKVELLVKDDGRGFGTKPLVDEGMGFHNMKYRTEKLGGILKITSTPRKGTEVKLSANIRP